MSKRLVTNSMLSTFKACRWKYWYSYLEGLRSAVEKKAPSRGSLFHRLLAGLYLYGEEFDHEGAILRWKDGQHKQAEAHYERIKKQYGTDDKTILATVLEQAESICEEIREVYLYYKSTTYQQDKLKYEALYVEQPFEVPVVDRADKRHMRWRFGGRWDIVVRSKSNGEIFMWDHKLTSSKPQAFIDSSSLSTQPVSYIWAARYLSVSDGISNEKFYEARKSLGGGSVLNVDGPSWSGSVPSGFCLSVTRRKVPKKPVTTKDKKRLNKTSMKDTTLELLEEAIRENGFNRSDYSAEIEKLHGSNSNFFVRQELEISMQDVERWMEETRLTCEEILRVERYGKDRLYRTDPSICQNQYFQKCEYWPLCYGDPEEAISNYMKIPGHSELVEDQE